MGKDKSHTITNRFSTEILRWQWSILQMRSLRGRGICELLIVLYTALCEYSLKEWAIRCSWCACCPGTWMLLWTSQIISLSTNTHNKQTKNEGSVWQRIIMKTTRQSRGRGEDIRPENWFSPAGYANLSGKEAQYHWGPLESSVAQPHQCQGHTVRISGHKCNRGAVVEWKAESAGLS